MLPWEIEIAIGSVALAFWVARGAQARRNLWWLAFGYVSLLVLLSMVGVVLAVAVLFDPFAGESVEIGNVLLARTAATGLTAFLLPTLVATLLYRRIPHALH